MTSLRQKAARGAISIVLAKASSVVLAQLTAVILPVLLSPEDFGVYGVAMFFVGFLIILGDFGFSAELIQRKERVEAALETAFTLRILMSIALIVASAAVGHLAARLYDDPRLQLPIMISSMALFLNAWTLVPRTLALRALDFKRAVVPDQLGKIALALSSISFAILGFGYWSLVLGSLAGPLVGLFAFSVLVPWKPRWRVESDVVRSLTSFGKYATIGTVTWFVVNSIPQALIGYTLGLDSMGFYLVAYTWAVGVPASIVAVLSGIAYPFYGAVKTQAERLRRAFSETLRFFSYLGVFVAAGVVSLSDAFVKSALGSRWEPSILLIQLLSVGGFALGWIMISNDLLNAAGKPKAVALVAAGGVLITATALYAGISFLGLVGAALAATGSLIILAVVAETLASREIGRDDRFTWFSHIGVPGLAGGIAAVLTIGVGLFLPATLPALAFRAVVYLFGYFGSMELLTRRRFLAEIRMVAKLAMTKTE